MQVKILPTEKAIMGQIKHLGLRLHKAGSFFSEVGSVVEMVLETEPQEWRRHSNHQATTLVLYVSVFCDTGSL